MDEFNRRLAQADGLKAEPDPRAVREPEHRARGDGSRFASEPAPA